MRETWRAHCVTDTLSVNQVYLSKLSTLSAVINLTAPAVSVLVFHDYVVNTWEWVTEMNTQSKNWKKIRSTAKANVTSKINRLSELMSSNNIQAVEETKIDLYETVNGFQLAHKVYHEEFWELLLTLIFNSYIPKRHKKTSSLMILLNGRLLVSLNNIC